MSNNKLKVLIGASVLLLLSCSKQTDICKQAETIVGRHVVRFTRPPQRIPTKFSVDAPLLGNGFTGIALSGTPEHQMFYVARNDFWRLKAGHNESYPAVLGKIEVSIPGLQGASYLAEQHLYDAMTVARFAKDGFAVTCRTYVAALDDVTVIEIGMEGKGSLEGNVRLSLPATGKEIVENLPRDRAFPEQREQNIADGIHYITRAFKDSVDIPTKAALALLAVDSPDGRFTLEPGKTIRLICATSGNFKSNDCLDAVLSKVRESATPQRLRELESQHREWWKNYWEKSFVSIPDSAVEGQYYLSLYGMASASRDTDFPPGLFGTWITQEQPGWAGDYHLNYNYQAPFYALYSANRIEQAEPYYAPLLAFMPRGKYYSEKIAGIPDGVLYPVGIGPLGIETTRWTPFMAANLTGWWTAVPINKNVEYDGMFWGQKSNVSYAVANLSMHFYRTWDREFARKVYPFVRAAAVFWEKYLVYEDGRYVDYNDAIHEGTVGDKNPLLSLGLIRQTMQTATDMSALLGEDTGRREKWMHIHDRISPYPVFERNGKTVFRYTETGIEWVDGNTLGIQHIYPGGAIGLDSDPELLAVAMNTMREMQRWMDGNGSNSFFPAAVRIGYDPDTILYHLDRYVKHTFPNGFQLDNPHGIENLSTVPNTVNEMLCMGHQDVVRLFPVWPRNRDASFHQIRVEGAFLVSAKLKGGEIGDVTVFSEQGRELHLLNPWKGRKLKVKGPDGEQLYEGERIRIDTEKGVTYRLAPVEYNKNIMKRDCNTKGRIMCRTGLFLAGLILSAGVAFGATQASGFELTGDTPWLISEEQPEALERALNDVQVDWYKVFGRNPVVLSELPDDYTGAVIYLGLKGAWRNDLIKEPLSDWESYVLRLQQDSKGRPALVATGADVRGSIYAAYSLSEELLGVDPWYFWTDNEPAVRESITVPAGFDKSHGSPTFKYRGWFMNDEDLLNLFAPDPVRENVFSLEMFEKIYETILRLKGNMVAPATFPFPDERCQELAARRGLAINMHHILTLGLNTYRWPDGTPFSYSKDPGVMERYWQTCIDAFREYEVVWTVGYRGKHDRPFWADEPELKTPEERGAVITKAIAKQVEMIRRKHPDADIIANMWMEGSELYQKGFLKLPEGVTLVWADNGAGFISDKPLVNVWSNLTAPDEEGRVQKGNGIYYHTAMLNGRANQLSEMVPPARIYHEVLRFVKAGATMFFLDNVSDIRPVPMTTDCAMKLTWDVAPYIDKTDEENQANFLNDWSRRQFGTKMAGKVAANYGEYFHIPYISEQESDQGLNVRIHRVMNVTVPSVAENKSLDEEALKTVREQLKFAVENRVYIDRLSSKAASLTSQIPAGRKDFYQSHVLTQLLIHRQALTALEHACRSALAYQEGNKAQAISCLEKAIQACRDLFAGRHKAEYGKWAAWYRGDSFVGFVYTYDRLRILNARLKNESLPPVRKGREYREMEKYQERFKDNFPLLYPNK